MLVTTAQIKLEHQAYYSIFYCLTSSNIIIEVELYIQLITLYFDSCTDFNDSICRTGDVRLVNESTNNLGRADVCIGNEWGTIVRTGFDHTEARVICRQLGYYDKCELLYYTGFIAVLCTCMCMHL